MLVTPHIRSYQAAMPLPPEKSVPTTRQYEPLPTAAQAVNLTNPLAATPDNIAAGKVGYGYYCVQCHGQGGLGDGPVGESFIPIPANLRSAKVQGYSDGQLLRAMLTGAGHSPLRSELSQQRPVLEYVVLPEHRWYLVLYVRSLEPYGVRRP